MANLFVFHMGTCVNTNYTKIHTDLFFTCMLPTGSHKQPHKYAGTCVHVQPTGISFAATCSFTLMLKVGYYYFQSLWLNCKQIEWTRFN